MMSHWPTTGRFLAAGQELWRLYQLTRPRRMYRWPQVNLDIGHIAIYCTKNLTKAKTHNEKRKACYLTITLFKKLVVHKGPMKSEVRLDCFFSISAVLLLFWSK